MTGGVNRRKEGLHLSKFKHNIAGVNIIIISTTCLEKAKLTNGKNFLWELSHKGESHIIMSTDMQVVGNWLEWNVFLISSFNGN